MKPRVSRPQGAPIQVTGAQVVHINQANASAHERVAFKEEL